MGKANTLSARLGLGHSIWVNNTLEEEDNVSKEEEKEVNEKGRRRPSSARYQEKEANILPFLMRVQIQVLGLVLAPLFKFIGKL